LSVELRTGYFLFDVDVELAWGFIDKDSIAKLSRLMRYMGRAARQALDRLTSLLNKYEIPVTWGIVGGLLVKDIDELMSIIGETSSYDEVRTFYESRLQLTSFLSKGNPDAFYGQDVVNTIIDQVRESGVPHDIASHSLTHPVFNHSSCTREIAKIELDIWLTLFRREYNLVPKVFLFPRDSISHLDVLRDRGFMAFRGRLKDVRYSIGTLRLVAPPTPHPFIEQGLVNVPGSFSLTGLNTLDLLCFKLTMRRGISKAIKKRGVFHVTTHLHNLAMRGFLKRIEELFSLVKRHTDEGLTPTTIRFIAPDILESAEKL